MTLEWVPLGEDELKYKALHEDIPAWLVRPLWTWISEVTWFEQRFTAPRCREIFERLDLALRQPHSATDAVFSMHGLDFLKNNFDAEYILKIVDFLVVDNLTWGNPADNEDLEALLSQAGSAWRVGQRRGNAGLERRVPLGVQEAAEGVMQSAADAGARLSEAWHAVFGRTPDPDKAYKMAIVAIEESMLHKVTSRDLQGTLGKATTTLFQQGDWSLPILDDPTKSAYDVVYKMCRAILNGEEGRHGGNNYRKPTQQEAETAVMLAVPLA